MPALMETLRVSMPLQTLPSLSDARIVGEWVGIRPGTDKRDYCVRLLQTVCALPPKYRLCDQIDEPHPAWITVAGIRSTGV